MLSFAPRVHWLGPKPRAEAGEKAKGTGSDGAAGKTVSAQQLRSPGERAQGVRAMQTGAKGCAGHQAVTGEGTSDKDFCLCYLPLYDHLLATT